MLLVTLSKLSRNNLFLVLFLSVFAPPLSAVYLGSSEFNLLVKRIIFFLEFYFREGGHIDLTGVSRNGDSYFSFALAIADSMRWSCSCTVIGSGSFEWEILFLSLGVAYFFWGNAPSCGDWESLALGCLKLAVRLLLPFGLLEVDLLLSWKGFKWGFTSPEPLPYFCSNWLKFIQEPAIVVFNYDDF